LLFLQRVLLIILFYLLLKNNQLLQRFKQSQKESLEWKKTFEDELAKVILEAKKQNNRLEYNYFLKVETLESKIKLNEENLRTVKDQHHETQTQVF
jgi:hypothetical protein